MTNQNMIKLKTFKAKIKVFVFLMMLTSTVAWAHDFGQAGQVFVVLEPDLIHVMQTHLLQLQQSGAMQKLNQALSANVQTQAITPMPVKGISETLVPASWDYDPSIIMPQTMYAPDGTVIIRAGETYNPLKMIQLDETLLFYDADSPKQIAWAKAQDKIYHGQDKLILVKGNVASQSKIFQKPIYFDQLGRLTQRFHIQHVPAKVFQQGHVLKVSEVVP